MQQMYLYLTHTSIRVCITSTAGFNTKTSAFYTQNTYSFRPFLATHSPYFPTPH